MKPETQYARNAEDQYIAYQVCGNGEFDIIFIPDWCTNLEVMWEEPTLERYLNRLASMARLICFDKRGTGVSDPVPLGAVPTFEEWMDDVGFVLDAAGSERAAVIGHGDGAPMAIRGGSGGRGRWRGGDGLVREIEFLAPLEFSILSQHRVSVPYGMAGGGEGAVGRQVIIGADGGRRELEGIDGVEVAAGDRVILETPGGGGYGSER